MIKLFTLELQNNDPLAFASEVKSIMHDIKVTKVELDITLISFLKALYPTYSNYLESLQANGNLRDITFDSLLKKIIERQKAFGKKTTPESSEEVVCLAHKEKNITQDSSRGRGGQRGRGRYAAKEMDHMMPPHASYLGTNLSSKETNPKVKLITQTEVKHLNSLIMLWHIVILGVDGAVYFADQSKLKPSGLGTIRLKLCGLLDFLLRHVLYLPQLTRNLLSLVHICQQGHSIHMFEGKIEVRKASDHSLDMIGIEEERLLKLHGTSPRARHFSYNSHHEEGTLPSSLLWQDRFGHFNYDSLRLLKKNGVSGLPTIPRKLK
eukprot:PITA_07027